MSNKKKTALFSIEIAARELLPKCLLALETAKSGMRVYIGSFRAMKQLEGKIDECIFFHKSTWANNAPRLKKTIGAHFVFLDEEMGVAIPESQLKTHLSARYKHVTSDSYRDSFAIGDMHKECMESLDVFNGVNVHALGWPRLDLWREPFHELYDSEVRKIKEEEGDYYLIVSSFGMISESSHKDAVKLFAENYNVDSNLADFKYGQFKSCIKTIGELSPKLKPDEKIIVRPHTSESLDEWERVLESYPNVIIRQKGDITPWLLASKGTLQFGSTVAIQAAFLGIPSIQLEPDQKLPSLTDTAPFEILESTKSTDEILTFFRAPAHIHAKKIRLIAIDRLEGIVSCLDGPMASTKIAAVLQAIQVAPKPPIRLTWPQRFLICFKERINYLNYLKSRLLKKERLRLKRSKFEKIPNGLKEAEIGENIRELAKILGDDTDRIKCRQVAHNLVEIEFD